MFDVTALEFVGPADGDDVLLAACAEALRLSTARVESWGIQQFCTPYYATTVALTIGRTRLSVAWRVTMKVTGDANYFDYGGIGPVAVFGTDTTWLDEGRWEGEPLDCVVIVDEGPDKDFAFLEELTPDAKVEVLDYVVPGEPSNRRESILGSWSSPPRQTGWQGWSRHAIYGWRPPTGPSPTSAQPGTPEFPEATPVVSVSGKRLTACCYLPS